MEGVACSLQTMSSSSEGKDSFFLAPVTTTTTRTVTPFILLGEENFRGWKKKKLKQLNRERGGEKKRNKRSELFPRTMDVKFIPKLEQTSDRHKGQMGRIGVFGGSKEYTGAPYFAAISALRCGADLCHVFCATAAAGPIKCYSPELIVHGVVHDSDDASTRDREHTATASAEAMVKWFPAIDCLVVGPGMGRDECVLGAAARVLAAARTSDLPVVIDGDGLWLVSQRPDVVRGNPLALLTPNAVEFGRLTKALTMKDDAGVAAVSKELGGVTILSKGMIDRISDGVHEVEGKEPGSPRRCGGQGDVLAGTAGTFLAWATKAKQGPEPSATIAAAACASRLTRRCAARAFSRLHRATLTSDLIDEIGHAFEDVFGSQ